MSRGVGVLQRFVVGELEARRSQEGDAPYRWQFVFELAADYQHRLTCDGECDGTGSPGCRFGYEMTRSDVESMRRAVKGLAARGVVEVTYRYSQRPARHVVPRASRVYADDRQTVDADRRMLSTRLTLSVEELEKVRAFQRLEADRLYRLGLDWERAARVSEMTAS